MIQTDSPATKPINFQTSSPQLSASCLPACPPVCPPATAVSLPSKTADAPASDDGLCQPQTPISRPASPLGRIGFLLLAGLFGPSTAPKSRATSPRTQQTHAFARPLLLYHSNPLANPRRPRAFCALFLLHAFALAKNSDSFDSCSHQLLPCLSLVRLTPPSSRRLLLYRPACILALWSPMPGLPLLFNFSLQVGSFSFSLLPSQSIHPYEL